MTDDRKITMEQAMNLLVRGVEGDDLLPYEIIARVVVDINRIANALERRGSVDPGFH